MLVEHADGRFSLMTAESFEARGGGGVLRVAEPPDFTVAGETTSFPYYPVRTIDGRPTLRIQPITTWAEE